MGRPCTYIKESAKFLGSIIHRDGTDTADVDARIRSAKGAFGALRQCLFARKDVTLEGKRAVYTALILSVLLYGSESRVLTEELWGKLRVFHAQCVRGMCRVDRWHTRRC